MILSKGDTITTINNNSWIVKSQTEIGEYQVCKKNKYWACTCPDFESNVATAHPIAAELWGMVIKIEIYLDLNTN